MSKITVQPADSRASSRANKPALEDRRVRRALVRLDPDPLLPAQHAHDVRRLPVDPAPLRMNAFPSGGVGAFTFVFAQNTAFVDVYAQVLLYFAELLLKLGPLFLGFLPVLEEFFFR